VLARGGQRRLVAWHNALLRDPDGRPVGTLSSGLDISDRRRTEEALRESEEWFRTLFEGAHDGMLVADSASHRFVAGNRAICAMLGYTQQEIVGLGVDEIHPRADLPRVLAHFERSLTVARDLPVLRRDGSIFLADISVSPVALEGRACRLGVFRDVTERCLAEERRLRLEARALEAQKLESLGVLAGGIAHDFNNLLVAMMGHADLALAELPATSPAADSVAEVLVAAGHAADLCRQMLAYAGQGRLTVEEVDLSGLVREMAHLLEVSVARRATLRTRLELDLPPVEGDATQLRQVVVNLLTNAAEAIGAEGGVIGLRTGVVRCDRAELAATCLDDGLPAGRYVFLEVADSGCGMDVETRRRVFEPFFTTKAAGRGLGLAAALGIVRGHRGAIRIDTAPGRGSTITVLLPALGRALAARPAAVKPGEGWTARGTALLVDDEESVRAVGRQMLAGLGFEVLTAVDGQEAVELFRDRADGIACVVLDLSMPRLAGEAALTQMRAVRPDVPVLLTSGYCRPETLDRADTSGPTGFIQKPYRSTDLQEKLHELLGVCRAEVR
jgi:two-component system, cell cycle sensor histidine kinase and response regulator CckA